MGARCSPGKALLRASRTMRRRTSHRKTHTGAGLTALPSLRRRRAPWPCNGLSARWLVVRGQWTPGMPPPPTATPRCSPCRTRPPSGSSTGLTRKCIGRPQAGEGCPSRWPTPASGWPWCRCVDGAPVGGVRARLSLAMPPMAPWGSQRTRRSPPTRSTRRSGRLAGKSLVHMTPRAACPRR